MVQEQRSRGAVDLWAWMTITSAEGLAERGGSLRQLRPDARLVRYLLGVAAFAGAYYIAAQGGYALQFTGSISAIWPPVGFAAAVLYLGGLRWWPGAVIGDLLSNDGASPVGTTTAATVANLAEVTVMTLLLWRLIGRRAQLDTLAQVGRTLAAIAPAVAITATVATVALLVDGTIQSHDIPSIWRTIWIGDASGALVVLPLILVWAHFPSPAWRARSPIEAAAMIAAVVGLSVLALSSNRPFAYVVFPALIWAALRFGPQGATLAPLPTITAVHRDHARAGVRSVLSGRAERGGSSRAAAGRPGVSETLLHRRPCGYDSRASASVGHRGEGEAARRLDARAGRPIHESVPAGEVDVPGRESPAGSRRQPLPSRVGLRDRC